MAEENTNVQGTEEPAAEPGASPERTFTQAEVDALIGRRVARALKGMPGEEELTAFRNWQKEHKDNEGTVAALTRERDEALAELTQHKRERYLIGKGVSAEDAEYYAFKIGKQVTDKLSFEQAADAYFKDNKVRSGGVRMDSAGQTGVGGGSASPNDTMNALLRGKRN